MVPCLAETHHSVRGWDGRRRHCAPQGSPGDQVEGDTGSTERKYVLKLTTHNARMYQSIATVLINTWNVYPIAKKKSQPINQISHAKYTLFVIIINTIY